MSALGMPPWIKSSQKALAGEEAFGIDRFSAVLRVLSSVDPLDCGYPILPQVFFLLDISLTTLPEFNVDY